MKKINRYAMLFFLTAAICFLAQCGAAFSSEVSRHNEEQAAKQAAIKILHDQGCTFPGLSRMAQFVVNDNGDKTLKIDGYSVLVQCLEWRTATPPTAVSARVQINWADPTTRANGAKLTDAELARFDIWECTGTTAATCTNKTASVVNALGASGTATITGVSAGTHYYALTAVDTNGLASTLSPLLSVAVK